MLVTLLLNKLVKTMHKANPNTHTNNFKQAKPNSGVQMKTELLTTNAT